MRDFLIELHSPDSHAGRRPHLTVSQTAGAIKPPFRIDAALPASGGRNNPTIDSNMDKNDIEAFSDERSTEKELEYKNSDNKDSQSKGSE